MFENFKKITIKGGCFESDTELEVFKKDEMSVVYGRNGSGKTTIAHCIGELAKPDAERSTDYTVTSDAAIPEDRKQSVFIFDEDFVRDQVRVEKDGINTIVMLGEQVELDEQIAKKKEDLLKREAEYAALDEMRKKYESAAENISPLFHFNRLRDALRAEDGWAEIDRQLKGNKVLSRITEDVINTLTSLEEPKETYDQLKAQMEADKELYLRSADAQPVVWTNPLEMLVMPEDLQALKELVEKKVDAPILSEREQRIVNLLALHPQHSTQETRQMIAEGWEFCPLCLREISAQDADSISKTLTDILNDEADKYTRLLNEELGKWSPIEQELPVFPGELHKDDVNTARVAQDNLNKIRERVRDFIEERKRRIYEERPVTVTEDLITTYGECLANWRTSIGVIVLRVRDFNETVNKRTALYDKVRGENNLVARKQLAALLESYKRAVADSNKNRADLEAKRVECEAVRVAIKALQQQKENTDIALEYINKELQYVFYSNRKVRLEPGDGCYKLKINGRNVAPKKISVGERNVLGLCYFFAKLFGGKTDSGKYASEYLLVIDDPVSSFDYGNRVGVMSLLRFQFGNILKGNANSRILVMSHDLHSVFDLVKIRNEVIGGKGRDCYFMELLNCKLEVRYLQNEYKRLLTFVFDYASKVGADDPDETQEMSIGNVMRRMMEAFSSFCYNDSFEKMVRKEDVLDLIKDPQRRSYYANFMGRLTLNTESHMAESVYNLDSISTCFTRDEKVQTAKSVLLFLLYVNKPHLSAYLDEAQLTTIEGWKTEEAGWLVG